MAESDEAKAAASEYNKIIRKEKRKKSTKKAEADDAIEGNGMDNEEIENKLEEPE